MKDRYISVAPYSTTYQWEDGHIETWFSDTLVEAICWFWQDHRLSQPEFRRIVDSTGRQIQVEHYRLHGVYAYAITREVMDCTATLNPGSSAVFDEVLALLEIHA